MDIAKLLRSGAKRIITQFTPGGEAYDGTRFVSSSHPTREFVFALAGKCELMLDRQIYPLGSGEVMLFDSWVEHSFQYTPADDGLLHLWIYLENKRLRGAFVRVEKGNLVLGELPRLVFPAEIKHLLERRWERFSALKSPTEDEVHDELSAIINLVLDEAALKLLSPGTDTPGTLLSEKVSSYIRSCNGRNCSLETLGKIFSCSKFHLSHCFLREMGMSVGKFIDEVRHDYVSAARNCGLRQKEIAAELGFSSPSSFANWQKRTGRKGKSDCGEVG